MTQTRKETITFELEGQEMEDGRIYVSSKTLKGFHYILDENEDPEVMTDVLTSFMSAYLKAEINKVTQAVTPQAYRQRDLNLHRPNRRLQFVAEAIAA